MQYLAEEGFAPKAIIMKSIHYYEKDKAIYEEISKLSEKETE
jgi:hypothetical protein